MKIAVTGASGLVGSALVPFLQAKGHQMILIKRNLDEGYLFKPEELEGIDAVINLAGASVARRWTEAVKKEIEKSRVVTTMRLSHAINALKNPPKVVINASAIGYYGNRGDETLVESSSSGRGFLADVVTRWEGALQLQSTRAVFARFGIILSPKGGALAKMLPIFKMGLGGIIGSGEQWMSVVTLEDVLQAVDHLLRHPEIQGAVNIVSPNPVTNRTFTKTLGEQLHRPTFLPLPAFAVRLVFGEMGEELLLSSTKVMPEVLLKSGYAFLHPRGF